MAEEKTVIIDVEVDTKDFDKEIGKVNTELADNQKLIRELKKDYAGNATEIAKLEGKNKDLAKSKGELIKESKTEKGSLGALRLELAKQTKERNELNKSSEEGAERFEELQKSIKGLNDEVSGFEEAGGDFRRNVGDYPSVTDSATSSLKGLWATFMANPILLIVGLLAGLIKIFSESQAGAEFFAKAGAALNLVLSKLKDVVEFLGVALIDAFSDPQKALEDFGTLIKDNIVNRFQGILELIPNLAKAVKLLFEREFAEAAQVAADAVVKMTLGVDDFTNKVKNTAKDIKDFVNEVVVLSGVAFDLEARMIANTKAISDLEVAQSETIKTQKELELIIDDTTKSLEERIAAAQKFGEIEVAQAEESVRLSKERLAIIEEENALSNSLEEDLQQVRDEKIRLNNLEAASADLRRAALSKENALRKEQRDKNAAEETAAKAKLLKEEQDFAKAILDIAKQQDKEDEEFAKKAKDREDAARTERARLDELSFLDRIALAQTEQEIKEALIKQGKDVFIKAIGESSRVAKIAATIQAGINVAEAVTKMLGSGFPPFNFIAAGLVGVAGAIQIAKINSAPGPGGGGSSSSSRRGPTINQQRTSAVNTQTVNREAQERDRSERSFRRESRRPIQVAVTDINTAQNSRAVKVSEAELF